MSAPLPEPVSEFVLPEQFDESQNRHLVSTLQAVVDVVHADHPDWSQVVVAHARIEDSHEVGVWVGLDGHPALHFHAMDQDLMDRYASIAEGFVHSADGQEQNWNVLFAQVLATGEGLAQARQLGGVAPGCVNDQVFMGLHFAVKNPGAESSTHTWGVFGQDVPDIGGYVESLVAQTVDHLRSPGQDQDWVRAALVIALSRTETEEEIVVEPHLHLYAVRGDADSGVFLDLTPPAVDIAPLLGLPHDLYVVRLAPDAKSADAIQGTFTAMSPQDIGRDPMEAVHDHDLVNAWIWEQSL